MVQSANGKQYNSEEKYLLVYLKLTAKNMLKFMLNLRKQNLNQSITCNLGNKELYREAESLNEMRVWKTCQ